MNITEKFTDYNPSNNIWIDGSYISLELFSLYNFILKMVKIYFIVNHIADFIFYHYKVLNRQNYTEFNFLKNFYLYLVAPKFLTRFTYINLKILKRIFYEKHQFEQD
jgi:hypothetical protein